VLEVRLGGQLGNAIRRELAAQEKMELLAEFQAFALECGVLTGRTAQVEQAQSAGAFAEALHEEHQLSAAFLIDAGDTADQIAVVAPGLQPQRPVRSFQREIVLRDVHQFFAGLGQRRLGAGGDETFDRLAKFDHDSTKAWGSCRERRVGCGGLR
jgi:hypothetical protein